MPRIEYKNIQNGVEVLRTANEHERYLPKREDFEVLFFNGCKDIVDSWSVIELTNGTAVYTVKYKTYSKQINILWGPLKNSGTRGNERKRLQVLPSTPLEEATPYFAIGAYYTGDHHIYVTVVRGISTFISHAKNGSSYSSLWIDYPSLWEVYKNGIHSWNDSVGRTLEGCTEGHINHIHTAILETVKKDVDDAEPVESTPSEFDFIDFTGEIDSYHETDALPRNSRFKEIALERENHTCELCGTRDTFTDRNNKEYFEGHHLIMYNPRVQKRFKYCLDHPSNIICLCPECHRKIHQSSEDYTKELVVKLFKKHNDLLKSYNIKDLIPIINDYMTHNE